MSEALNCTAVVAYGSLQIPVSVEFRSRKRLTISVHPDGLVTAFAPVGCSLEQVVARLDRRSSWIARQLRHFEAYQPLLGATRFISGETHLYLGRQYRLRVIPAGDERVKLRGRYLNVYVRKPREVSCVRAAVERWYGVHSEPIYRDRLRRCLESTPSPRRSEPTLRIRKMNGRWGSCSKAGTITLSTELIKAPLHCLEYVITHEVCHLIIHNHSPAFFRLLSRCMPDWEKRKQRLDAVVLR